MSGSLPFSRPRRRVPSVVPQTVEPVGGELGVADGMLNAAVAEILLQGAGVDALIRQCKTSAMSELVRMDRPSEAGRLADRCQRLAEPGRGHRAAALGLKDELSLGPVAPQLAQSTDLGATQRLRRGTPVLQPGDVQDPGAEVDLRPGERAELRDPQAVGKGDEDRRGVALTVAPALPGGLDQLLDLGGCQMLARPDLDVRLPFWAAQSWRRI